MGGIQSLPVSQKWSKGPRLMESAVEYFWLTEDNTSINRHFVSTVPAMGR